MKIRDISGHKFHKLTVLSVAGRAANRQTIWRCICDCGNTADVVRSSLIDGHTKSCGCIHRRANGEARNGKQTPEYIAWAGLKRRCEVESDPKYKDYGARGIRVCARWRHSFPNFLEDVGRRPTNKHSLDRIDNDGNYEPSNIRWATRSQQQKNKRKPRRWRWHRAAKSAYDVVRVFEATIANYAGSKHAVSVESCTAALFLACKYLKVKEVEIPKLTYCSVPMQIRHAGGTVKFRDENWLGFYQLKPYPIYDSARNFTSGMYLPKSFLCASFHWSKHLPIGRGGAILFDDDNAVEWFKRARFDGRKEGVNPKHDKGLMLGWHFYMTPPQAAQGLMLMAAINQHNDPLPNDDYADLSLTDWNSLK